MHLRIDQLSVVDFHSSRSIDFDCTADFIFWFVTYVLYESAVFYRHIYY